MSSKQYNFSFAGQNFSFDLPQVSEAGVKQTASLLGRYFPELSVDISPKGKRGGRLGRGDTAQVATRMTMRPLPGAPTFNITQTASPTMTASPTINVTAPRLPVAPAAVPAAAPTPTKFTPPAPTPTTQPVSAPIKPVIPVITPTPAPAPAPAPIPTPAPAKPQLVPDPYNWVGEQVGTFQAKPIGGRASTYTGTVVVGSDNRMRTERVLSYPKPERFKTLEEIIGSSTEAPVTTTPPIASSAQAATPTDAWTMFGQAQNKALADQGLRRVYRQDRSSALVPIQSPVQTRRSMK